MVAPWKRGAAIYFREKALMFQVMAQFIFDWLTGAITFLKGLGVNFFSLRHATSSETVEFPCRFAGTKQQRIFFQNQVIFWCAVRIKWI